jgi:CRP-like cAMP-binding protein
MKDLIKQLEKHTFISQELAYLIERRGIKCRFKTRERLLVPNQEQESILFVKSGIIRNYYKSDTMEWTSRFSQPGDFVISIDNLLFNLPCNEFIETCTPVELISFTKKDYAELMFCYSELLIVARNIANERLRESTNRMYSWRMLSASERYNQFVKDEPCLAKQVQCQHIASYLNISSYHLSRIRKQNSKRPNN